VGKPECAGRVPERKEKPRPKRSSEGTSDRYGPVFATSKELRSRKRLGTEKLKFWKVTGRKKAELGGRSIIGKSKKTEKASQEGKKRSNKLSGGAMGHTEKRRRELPKRNHLQGCANARKGGVQKHPGALPGLVL